MQISALGECPNALSSHRLLHVQEETMLTKANTFTFWFSEVMFWYRIKLCTVICLKLKRCSAAVTIPRRDVGLKHPRFQSVVEENVEAEQFVAAVATADISRDGAADVRLRAASQ